MKQKKRKAPSRDVFDNKIVRGIIWSLCYTVNPNDGLEPKHLRYLLMDEYATPERIKNEPQTAYNYRKIEDFFKTHQKSENRYCGVIKSGNRSHLNHYLNHRLGESKKGLRFVHKKGKKYYVTSKGMVELSRYIVKKILERYEFSEIKSFYDEIEGIKFNQVFYGVTKEERNSLMRTDRGEDNKKIKYLRELIFLSLLEIEKIIKKKESLEAPQMAFVQCYLKK